MGATLVIRSEKRGVMGMSKAGAGVKGSSCRVYLQVYARDFYINWEINGGEYHVRTEMVDEDFP